MTGQLSQGHRTKWLTYLALAAVVGAILGSYGFEFFYLLSSTTADWFGLAGKFCLILLLLLPIGALIKLRWKWIAIFAVAWVLIFLPELGVLAPFQWLSGQGFRVRTLLDQDYLSRCRLTDVVVSGQTQKVGFCDHFDHVKMCDYVMYDPTGQFVVPSSRRTPEWRQAIAAVAANSLVSPDDDALHLFGNFYRVMTISGPGCLR